MRRIASWPLLLTISTCTLLNSCSSYVANSPGGSNPSKSTPVITWAQPAAITNPTPLGSGQLDATANVAGTFDYTPASGTVLAAGTATLTTFFTPTDTARYNTAAASVTLVVNPTAAQCPPPGTQLKTGNAHLAISDWNNSRVLIFDAPFTTGECASVVLGQADFDHITWYGEAPNLLTGPAGLGVDASGNLYVADYNNGRVMQFRPPFATGMDARLELGVPDFSAPGDNNATNCYYNPPAMSLCMPAGVTVDSKGNVWVADRWEGRVLEYQPPIQQAMDTSIAIGHPSLNETADCNGVYTVTREPPTSDYLTAAQFCDPNAVAFDWKGNLWVVDAANSRVVEFVPPFSTGMAASVELGFPAAEGLTPEIPDTDCSRALGTSASSFCGPSSLAFDGKGNLWVMDSGNNRVLEFSPPFSNGMEADLVIGQPDFTHRNSKPASANTLYAPYGLTFDANGNLIVSDFSNSRVLIFVPPFSDGMNASAVIGQTDMTTGTAHGCWDGTWAGDNFPSASTLCGPNGVLTF